MAIVVTSLINTSSATDATSYNTASFAPTNGRLVLAFISSGDASGPADEPTLSGGGVTTWTKITTKLGTADNRFRITVFRAQQSSYGSAAALTATFGSTQARCFIQVVELTGTVSDTSGNGTNCIVQSPANEGTSTSGTVALSAYGSTGNGTVAGWFAAATATFTASGGYTELIETGVVETCNQQISWRNDNDPTPDATVTLSASVLWLGIALEVRVPIEGAAAADIAITATALGGLKHSGASAADIAITGTAAAVVYAAADPTMAIELGYDAGPMDALSTVAWTDVTADCRSWNVRRGRQHELQQFDAGTASIVLNNRERAYDPTRSTIAALFYDSFDELASTPDHPTLDITGDIDIRVAFAPELLSGNVNLLQKGDGATLAYGLSWRASTSKIRLIWSETGVAEFQESSAVTLGSDPIALRATLDVDNGSGQLLASFYTKTLDMSANLLAQVQSNSGWTAAGTASDSSTSISATSGVLVVGNAGIGTDDDAAVLATVVMSGIGGTEVANPDFSSQTVGATSFNDAAGRTWTVSGGAEIRTYIGPPRPLLRVRISTTYQGTTYRHFTGYLESVELDYIKGPTNDRGDAIAILRAVDASKLLNLMHFDSSHFREEVLDLTPDLYWPLDDEATLTARDLSGNNRTGTYATEVERGVPTTYPIGEDGGACIVTSLARIARADTVNYERTSSWTVGFIARFDQDEATDGVLLGSFKDTSPYKGWFVSFVDGRFLQFSLVNSASNKIERQAMFPIQDARQHLVLITYSGTSLASGVTFYVDGVAVGMKSITDALGANSITDVDAEFNVGGPEASSALSHIFVIPSAISSTQAETIYNAMVYPFEKRDPADFVGRLLDFLGWPTADRDLPAGGTTLDGPLTSFRDPLPLIQAIATSEFGGGGFYVKGDGQIRVDHRYSLTGSPTIEATFGDTGAESNEARYMLINPVFDDTDLWTEVHIETDKGSNPVILTDSASEALYFKRAMTVGGLWASSEMARAVGQRLLERFSEPRLRFPEIHLPQGQAGSGRFIQMLARDLNDRITVKRRPTGGGDVISQECWVEGVTLSWRPKRWRMSMQLTPADTSASYFTLGSSEPDDGHVLGE